jgi:exopolyphosphatase/guanosine-5'-triphosphate,3'-diphosphate pyrophosphatase
VIASDIKGALFGRRREDARQAVIDIGSNTVRLVIYGAPRRAPTVVWNEKVAARLGSELGKSGTMSAEAMTEALDALARYARILADLGIEDVTAVATAAPRDSDNGPEFLERARGTGLPVRLLSGEEEAVASAYGTIGAFPGAHGVVADLGGGSLELVSVADGGCHDGASFPLGTLRLPGLRAKGHFERKVEKLLKAESWAQAHAGPLYMVGGTWRAFAVYATRGMYYPLTDPHGFTLGVEEALALAKTVQRSKPAKLAQIPGISSMRADKLPDAAALLRVLLAELQPEGLVFSSWGLREGLLFQRLAPAERDADPLLAGVERFAAVGATAMTHAALLARWTAAASNAWLRTERLRLAAAHLSLALHRVEPNLRQAHALEWALDKRWIGIDANGRAMLGAALLGSLGVTSHPVRLERLASQGELRQATGWGLAFRLAQRLGAGSKAALAGSSLEATGDALVLTLPRSHAALGTSLVEKDLGNLAGWLALEPALRRD